jgi:hypothetical protein
MEVFLQFGSAENPPMQTVKVEHKHTDVPRSALGRTMNVATGLMVKWENRWRRVYAVTTAANWPSLYLTINGEYVRVS